MFLCWSDHTVFCREHLLNMIFVSLCQYLVSVPLRMFRLWAFMGMMAQVRPKQKKFTKACMSRYNKILDGGQRYT